MTITEYINTFTSKPSIGYFINSIPTDEIEWFSRSLCLNVSDYIEQNYYSRVMFDRFVDIADVTKACNSVLHNKHYYYKGLVDLANADYDPLENYRMTESGTDTNSGTITSSANTSGTDSSTVQPSEDTTKSQTTSFESDTFRDSEKNTTNYGLKSSSGSSSATSSSTDTNSSQMNHSLTRYGNIGITTSEQMAESYHELSGKWYNIVEQIAIDFVNVLTYACY